jgi:hypothetical protein
MALVNQLVGGGGGVNNVVEFLLCSYSWGFFFFFFLALLLLEMCSCLLSSELECSCFLVLYFPMFFLVVAGFLLSLSVNVHGFFWVFCAKH